MYRTLCMQQATFVAAGKLRALSLLHPCDAATAGLRPQELLSLASDDGEGVPALLCERVVVNLLRVRAALPVRLFALMLSARGTVSGSAMSLGAISNAKPLGVTPGLTRCPFMRAVRVLNSAAV
jgi:hypothetical protein